MKTTTNKYKLQDHEYKTYKIIYADFCIDSDKNLMKTRHNKAT